MVSPLRRYANATLDLPVPSLAPLRFDEETGNPVFGSETVQLKAYLKDAGNAARSQLPGVDVTRVNVEGYLVDPIDFPSGTNTPLTLACTLSDGRRGELEILLSIPNPTGSERKTGRKIKGVFKLAKNP